MRLAHPALTGLLLIGAASWLAGCGDDASPPARDGGHDAGPSGCPSGQHLCGRVCFDDQPDDPSNGCRLGCGSPCPTPRGGEASCLADGRCDFTCAPPYVRSGDTCRCVPLTCRAASAECGVLDDGCGDRVDCGRCPMGRECVEGACACAEDAAEPNDFEVRAFRLGTFPDEPDTTMTYSDHTLDVADDVDYFRATVIDAASANPTIRVTLQDVPAADDWEIGAWFACDAGGDASRCEAGTSDSEHGTGCVDATGSTGMARVQLQTFCATTSEDGVLLIRVRPTIWTGSCAPYGLTVEVR